MSEKKPNPEKNWTSSWETSRRAQVSAVAKATPMQRLEWLEQALLLASTTGALERANTKERRRRRGLD